MGPSSTPWPSGKAGEPEPGVFGSLEPEPLEKKKEPEPEPLGKKVRSRSR